MSIPVLAAFLEACGGSGTVLHGTTVRRGGTFNIAVQTPAYPLDPYLGGDPGAWTTWYPAVNYLVRVTADGEVLPELATSWTTPDARVWTIKLRQGVKFHNGKPFNADDVVSTFKRLTDASTKTTALSVYGSFLKPDGITKVDADTVQFSLTRPVADLPFTLFAYQAAIMPSDWPGDWANNPNGTGPFKMTNYRPTQSAEFTRNADYWQPGLPYLDHIRVTYYNDTGAQVTAIQSGSVDFLNSTPPASVPALEGDPNIQLLSAAGDGNPAFAMHFEGPFSNKQVRQAFAWTIDRHQIISGLFPGIAVAANDHLIAPVFLAAFPRIQLPPQRNQNIAMARQLLTDAGFPNGIDVELHTHDIAGLKELAQAVVDMAGQAGIRIKLTVEPDEIFYQHWTSVPFALEAWSSRPAATQLLTLAYRVGSPFNMPNFNNPKFESLMNQFDATVGTTARTQVAGQIAQLMWDELPAVIPLFYKTTKAARKRVEGLAAEPSGYYDPRPVWLG